MERLGSAPCRTSATRSRRDVRPPSRRWRTHLRQAIAFAAAGENYSWAKAIPPYLDVLLRLERQEEARAVADAAFEDAQRVAIARVYCRHIEAMVALVWAKTGESERARSTFERLRTEATALGLQGAALAALEETCARAALATGDAAAFDRAAEGMASVFAEHEIPTLSARYRRLMYDASRAGLEGHGSHPAPSVEDDLDSVEHVRERIDHATSGMRFRRALSLLIEHSGARSGHMFAFVEGQVKLVASIGEMKVQTTGLYDFLRGLAVDGVTMPLSATHLTATRTGAEPNWTSDVGAIYEPAILATPDGQPRYVAMLERGDTNLRPLPYRLTRSMAEVLAG
jgi:hypothetical protein